MGDIAGTPRWTARLRNGLCVATAMAAAAAVLVALPREAHATAPNVTWDSDGIAAIPAPPFTFEFELADFYSPKEIIEEGAVRVDISAELDTGACSGPVRATPMVDGLPKGEPAYLDMEYTDEFVAIWLPVNGLGVYSVLLEASVGTDAAQCTSSTRPTTPYSTTIEMFSITEPLPGPPPPASRTPVTITSSGPSTLVANTRGRSPSIKIRFDIKDPEKRRDLLNSVCMNDSSDCWVEDRPLKRKWYSYPTSTGWERTWGFWWEKASYSSCLSYRYNRPYVSVLLIVSNSDGKVLGRKKHTVRLTCSG